MTQMRPGRVNSNCRSWSRNRPDFCFWVQCGLMLASKIIRLLSSNQASRDTQDYSTKFSTFRQSCFANMLMQKSWNSISAVWKSSTMSVDMCSDAWTWHNHFSGRCVSATPWHNGTVPCAATKNSQTSLCDEDCTTSSAPVCTFSK